MPRVLLLLFLVFFSTEVYSAKRAISGRAGNKKLSSNAKGKTLEFIQKNSGLLSVCSVGLIS